MEDGVDGIAEYDLLLHSRYKEFFLSLCEAANRTHQRRPIIQYSSVHLMRKLRRMPVKLYSSVFIDQQAYNVCDIIPFIFSIHKMTL